MSVQVYDCNKPDDREIIKQLQSAAELQRTNFM